MQNNDPQSPIEAQDRRIGESVGECRTQRCRHAGRAGSQQCRAARDRAARKGRDRKPAPPLHRDLEQARRFANEKLLNELLPVYDGLEGGLAVEGGDIASMREGISLTLKSLLKVAENNGMSQIDPLGQPLDPERHHAVSMVEAPGKAPGTVVSVLQKGYVLNDRLLRPALVAVAKD
jgi:molecular chaperone GrpE